MLAEAMAQASGLAINVGPCISDDKEQRKQTYLKGAAAYKRELAERRASVPSIEHEVPAEFLGIGIRIEDDLLVTSDGSETLSAAVPSDPDSIERLCAERSRLPRLGS